MRYKHILVASDLTPESVELCHSAKEIAEYFDAKTGILHVIEPSPLLYGGGEFVIPLGIDIETSLAEEAKSSLDKQCAVLNIPKAEQWVVTGNIREEVVRLVQTQHIDLIVVGGRNRHGLHLLLSSTTDTVVHALPCDVLVVRVAGS